MSKRVLFSIGLQEFRPIIWYGEPVFVRYSQLKTILNEKLGEKYANFLAEPVAGREVLEGKGQAHWMSDYIQEGKPFTKIPPQQQEIVRQQLTLMINKIKGFAKELQSTDDMNQKQLGELLVLAIEVPALDFVFVEGDKICLALWGFTSEEAKKTNFQISKVLEAPIVPVVPPQPIAEQPIIQDEKINLEKQLDQNRNIQSQQPVVQNQAPTPPPPVVPPVAPSNKKGMPGWLWFLIGALIMFLILFLIWWFFLRHPALLPPHADKVPPIDTTKVGTDPNDPTKRKILTDKINVVLKKGATAEKFAKLIDTKYKGTLVIVLYDTVVNLLQLRTPAGEWKKWGDSLKKIEDVRLTFSEALFQRSEQYNDPAFSDAKKSWYFKEIGVFEAWKITKGSPDVIVAVIDNGFDLTHPEFKDKIVKPWNVFTHSPDVKNVRVQGGEHGTHVAGSAIGLLNNNLGIAGIAPNCKFMPIQVADENGNMSSLSVVMGILYAIHQGAHIVNMSLGMMFPPDIKAMPENQQKELIQTVFPEEAQFWNELYSFGVENKMIIVQAAGNDNVLAGIDPAARSKNTIIVSAVSPNIKKAQFSNWGEFSVLSAPGVEIYSSVPNNQYGFLQGTSMASPIVAGCAALMRSKFPNLTAKQIIDIMVKTAKPLDNQQYIGPLVQIDRALKGDTSKQNMIIPENPKDLSFAEGRWKSSTDLHSTIKNKKVELYFDINKDGTGKLTFSESDGNQCFADLKISFKEGKLLMDQTVNAKCQNNQFYYQYVFTCIPGSNKEAECKAQQKGTNEKLIEFNLVKQ